MPITLSKDQTELIKAVLYFDIFNYPLTREELYENSVITISYETYAAELATLVNYGLLKEEHNFILSSKSLGTTIERRLSGNAGAEKMMPLAYKYSKKVASFPFVEGICLSGGLSKNYCDENGDIDFFVITKPGRLWICRTLLIIKYKFLPRHKKKYWCINYLIASHNLSIPDHNAFAGTELAYLIPTVNYKVYENILQENNWYKSRFPNKQVLGNRDCIDTPEPLLKRWIEAPLSGSFGKWVDDFLLKITLSHWRKKYPELSHEDFDLQFRSRKDVCKRHTHGFQNIVLHKWKEKLNEYETLLNISLTKEYSA